MAGQNRPHPPWGLVPPVQIDPDSVNVATAWYRRATVAEAPANENSGCLPERYTEKMCQLVQLCYHKGISMIIQGIIYTDQAAKSAG